MHALMGKGNKTPTPQELYRARKQKEEAERNAFLPPGLVNHGNTCFMNSVLQGLIATPMLADIVRFSLPETYAPVSSHRSPQLTNGHGLGGEWEREPEEGMALGDTFVNLMLRAWKAQDDRVRTSLRPSDLLARLGSKFDQYLDFRQQDAHEFLRHLLDAMRMEEIDIIKKRQPMPPKPKRRRKRKSINAKNSRSSSPEEPNKNDIPEEDRLSSFVDMVFGGRLASILVCEKCKKISCTYEDFNDLSLSIKQEDYEKTRKRDRLKTLAKNLKFGMRGRGVTRESDLQEAGPGPGPGQAPRSSSVPSSPLRRSEEAEKSFELLLGDVQQRRRSLEAGEETPSLTNPVGEEGSPDSGDGSNERKAKDERRMLGVLDESKPFEEEDIQKEEPRRERDKDKDEDGWIKLRRKIGVGMGVKKPRKKSGQKESLPDLPSNDDSQADVTGDEAADSFVDVKSPSPSFISPAASPLLGASIALQKFSFVRRPSSSRTETASPSLSALPSPSRTPEIPTVALPPAEVRPSSPSLSPTPAPLLQEHHVRPKSPRPPKPSRSESVYLSRLLADVPSSSTSHNNTAFNLFRSGAQALSSSSPDISLADMRHSVWNGAKLGLGNVQSVEGCLKMFTAVEVLDGENMVGCRRCWKIQHGVYNPRGKEDEGEDGEDEDEDDEGADDNDEEEEEDHDGGNSSSSASVKINLDRGDRSHSREPAIGSTSTLSSSIELSEDVSVRSGSGPVSLPSTRSLESHDVQRAALLNTGTSSSPTLNVPSISTTAPDPSPLSPEQQTPTPIAGTASERTQAPSSTKLVSSPSRDSLQLPTARLGHFRQPAERRSSVTTSISDTGSLSSDDEAGMETETSLTASIRSDTSSARSIRLEPSGHSKGQDLSSSSIENELSSDVRTSSPRTKPNSGGGGSDKAKIPRSKQVIQRRAYKRYLIATPPPVLVVHLKRFHQVGGGGGSGSGGRFVPTQVQFFANFKKLDDTVGFPEYLDLGPFLLPSKEREGQGRKGKTKGKRRGKSKKGKKEKEREKGREGEDGGESEVKVAGADTEACMYRLYAVVVHIGNMLGGHYVAYTALPEPAPSSSHTTSKEDSSSILPQTDSTTPTETLRPENPRTSSFTRTANPSPNTSSTHKSRTSTSISSSAKGSGGGGGAQRQWCYISDTVVRLASLEEVLQAKAYICMYERI